MVNRARRYAVARTGVFERVMAPRARFELATLRLTAERIKNLSALSGVAYEKLGAIFPSLVAPTPAPTVRLNIRSIRLRLGTECLTASIRLLTFTSSVDSASFNPEIGLQRTGKLDPKLDRLIGASDVWQLPVVESSTDRCSRP